MQLHVFTGSLVAVLCSLCVQRVLAVLLRKFLAVLTLRKALGLELQPRPEDSSQMWRVDMRHNSTTSETSPRHIACVKRRWAVLTALCILLMFSI